MLDLLSPEVLLGLAETYGVPFVGAIVVLVVGWVLSGILSNGVAAALARTGRVDETLRIFFRSLIRYLLLAVTVIAVLELFGVKTTSLVAVLGAASLAIGLALQGTLQDVAAGVMLMIFRPFRIGDFIEAGGGSGTVKAITLFTTELATPDNVQIIAPNSKMWGAPVKNFSHHPTRRVDLVFGVSYKDDIGLAMQTIHGVAAADARALTEPGIFVGVTNLGDSSVDITLRVWALAGDNWGLRVDLLRAVKEALDAAGVSIPYPQMGVLVQRADGTSD